MDPAVYELTANAIDRCPLTVRDNSCNPPINRLITRNSSVLSYFGQENIPFQHRDSSTGILQVFDIFSNQLIKLNLNNIDEITYFCTPEWMSPVAVANELTYSDEYEHLLLQHMEPFFNDVKRSLEQNCFTDCSCLNQQEELIYITFRDLLTKNKLKIKDQRIYNYIFSGFHKRCNRYALNYIKKHFAYLNLYATLLLCETGAKLETIEDVIEYISNKPRVLQAWKGYLNKISLDQIKKYEEEYKTLCKEKFAGDEFQQERDFLQLQYNKAIEDVKALDFETQLSIYKNNVFLMLRYWPVELDKPVELQDIRTLSHFEHTLFQSLYINKITVEEDDINFVDVDLFSGQIIDQLNVKHLDNLKKVRMEQIRAHAETITANVLEEINDLETEDINDIISSIRDFDGFQERIDAIDNIASILQYWPSILLPAPEYVRRLGTVSQEVLDMYLTNAAKN